MKHIILVAFAFFSVPIACRTVGGDSAPALAKQRCMPIGREVACPNGKDWDSCKNEGLANQFRCKEKPDGSACMPIGTEVDCPNGEDWKSCKKDGLANHFRCKL